MTAIQYPHRDLNLRPEVIRRLAVLLVIVAVVISFGWATLRGPAGSAGPAPVHPPRPAAVQPTPAGPPSSEETLGRQ